jgi:hypothetical protein
MKTTFRNALFLLAMTFSFQGPHPDPTPLTPVVQVSEAEDYQDLSTKTHLNF